MNDSTIPLNHDALSALLNDTMMIRIVTVLNQAALSIPEILEYGFTRKDISRAMARGVVEFDTLPMSTMPQMMSKTEVIRQVLETGDYYFGVLNSKVRLTRLGLHMLEIIDAVQSPLEQEDIEQHEEFEGTLGKASPQL